MWTLIHRTKCFICPSGRRHAAPSQRTSRESLHVRLERQLTSLNQGCKPARSGAVPTACRLIPCMKFKANFSDTGLKLLEKGAGLLSPVNCSYLTSFEVPVI